MPNKRVTLEGLVADYRERRVKELVPEVDKSSFDQRDEENYDLERTGADRQVAEELEEVTRPKHPIERGFFWGSLGFLAAGLLAPNDAGPILSDAELALVGGAVGVLGGLLVRFSQSGA